MGFHRRKINQEMVLDIIDSPKDICRLVEADALFMDSWCKKFFDNLEFDYIKYNEKRNIIINDTKFDSSNLSIQKHSNFNSLKNISNIYINLKTYPSWVDLLLVDNILNINVKCRKQGCFEEIVELCISKIEEFYFN